MSSVHDPIRDIGPEFARAIDTQVARFARRFSEIARAAPNARTAGDLAQAEADRLLGISDEEVPRCSN